MTPPSETTPNASPLPAPVVVTGTPRSGKSLVANLIRHSGEFVWLSEPLMIWDAQLGRRRDDRRTGDQVNEKLRRQILSECRLSVERAGKLRYLDDLSYHALRIPFLLAVMPDVKIVHVIRDGRDAIPEMIFGWTYRDTVTKAVRRRWRGVRLQTLPRLAVRFLKNYLLSRIQQRRSTWGPRVPGMAEFAPSRSAAEVAAFQWQRMVEIALDDLSRLPADRALEVRFDRLISDPSGQARRVAEFCGVQEPEAVVAYAQRLIRPDHKFDRRVEPTDAQWAMIGELIDPLQKRLGYQE